MDCNVVKDLIPLYVDKCCSEESAKIVEKHTESCEECKKFFDEMNTLSYVAPVLQAPKTFKKLNDWKASLLQSVLLFFSFSLITLGVSLEAGTSSGLLNGFWAFNLVIPSTGFMLSLANWYFVKFYKSRKIFSNCSLVTTIVITLAAYIWTMFHYEINIFELCAGKSFAGIFEILYASILLNIVGILLTTVFFIFSKILSDNYAKMLGKE